MTALLDPKGMRVRAIVVYEEVLTADAVFVSFALRPQSQQYCAIITTTWLTDYATTETEATLSVQFAAPVPYGGGTVKCAIMYV